ncbi:Atg14 domain-containing protein [Pontibacter sp. HSC-36F09]|uniref:Atg14 domain-containing protein n=1 Tax=Pontibacter sp. HSC-36F09 TaxID=2910966 RepID=UPI0020A130B3|nr:Atg14 domain-containing protein [Pontibacter sp. HSC-36F09]MCP2042219.1 chromosome segregation ATPase [Pontibacter sp. HSC-36F09]
MKKQIIRTIGLGMALGLTVAVTQSAVAQQGKGNANRQATESGEEQEVREKNQNAKGNKVHQKNSKLEEKQERVQRDRAQTQGKKGHQQHDEAENGNAYGQDKGDMSGREFGQNRAADARMTGEERKARLETTVDEGDSKVKEAKDRIAKAKNDLEKNRKSGKITDTELDERRAAIERAENAVRVLEEWVKAGRARLQQ